MCCSWLVAAIAGGGDALMFLEARLEARWALDVGLWLFDAASKMKCGGVEVSGVA